MKPGMVILIAILLLFPYVIYGDDYIIGEGDTLRISVWGNNELSLVTKVRPDGKITVPALGEVSAAGFTPKVLQEELRKNMEKLVKGPIVTVIVEEINNNKVYVFGGGVKSGVFDLNRRTTLLQMLCVMELNNADLYNAYVLRKGKEVKKDFYRLFIEGKVEEDLVIEINDTVFIPALEDSNIYIVGAVNTPKFIKFREGLKVMEAVLEAGGFTKFANENRTVVLRKDGAKELSIPVKLKDLIKNGDLSQNIKLRPGDYIVVKEGMF